MSTLTKLSKLTSAPLSIFWKCNVTRYFYVQNDLWSSYVEQEAKRYSEQLNRIIQNLNMRSKSILIPYYQIISLRADNDPVFTRSICGYLRCRKKGKGINKSLYVPYVESDKTKYDYIVDFLLCSDYKMITASNRFCFKALGDKITLRSILTDVLLDDAICNSYFGIDSITDEQFSYINKCKMQFIKDNKMTCRYRINEADYDYIPALPFASFCRKDGEINPRKYLNTWEAFIEKYFRNEIQLIPSINEQLKLHEQYEQLPDRLENDIISKPAGTYLVLRINKEPKENSKEIIETLFGLDASIGKIKIVSLSDFFKEDFQFLIQNHVVSAFKVINNKF